MALVLSNIRVGELLPMRGHVVDGAPMVCLQADAVFDNSYATGGELLSPTLDSFFSDITAMFPSSNSGVSLEMVDNATLTSIKVKAYQAEGSHTHDVTIAGGADATNQHPVSVDTTTNLLQKAAEKVYGAEFAGSASYPTNGQTLDLSTIFSATPHVVINSEDDDYEATYVPGTGANDGKVKIRDKRRMVTTCTKVTGAASYAAGGQTVDLTALCGVVGVPDVVLCQSNIISDVMFKYIPGTGATDGKIAATVISTGVEVGNGVNLSGGAIQLIVAYAAEEVPNATNLSTKNFQYVAYGAVTNTTDETIAGAALASAGNAADEIAAAQDLSAITFSLLIIGKPKVQS